MYKLFSALILLTVVLFRSELQAQELSPEAKISILTCNPGTDVYSMYGHTAIRVHDPANRIDVVFNYGVFNFEAPNFLYRFAKGQTDYLMVGQTFRSFIPEYEKEQRSVYEQVLNLSVIGKNKLYQALMLNARTENREYRYNFFEDNCATRVRDMIEKNAGDTVQFVETNPRESYRELIKKFHHSFRWIDLGIDLLVGAKADDPVSSYGQMFLPEYLQNQFANAKIIIDDKPQPLVSDTRTLLEFPNTKLKSDLIWPSIVFGILFLFVASVSVRAFLRSRRTDWLDCWLFTLTGISGLIIGWFTLFSEHPAVSPNYNLLWAFPLHLPFAIIWKIKSWRPITRHYFWLTGGLLSLSLVAGQTFNPAVYLIVCTLLVRVGVNLVPESKMR